MKKRELDPSHCVQCGREVSLDEEVVRQEGWTALWFIISDPETGEERAVEIPGIWVCGSCAEGGGRIPVTPQIAVAYLLTAWIPNMLMSLHLNRANMPADEFAARMERVDVAIESASFLLDVKDNLAPEPGGGSGEEEGDAPDLPEDVKAAILASIQSDGEGRMTYVCPNCDQRHPVDELFEAGISFAGVGDDSKD